MNRVDVCRASAGGSTACGTGDARCLRGVRGPPRAVPHLQVKAYRSAGPRDAQTRGATARGRGA
ncbi:hypothetical protein WS50_14050 [Burkholderia territorii]|nr:hypothetical protein WS50_14050 [Burkholderia territorii]